MSTTPPSSHPPQSPAPPVAPSVAEHDALPLGTRFGEFEILRVVGVGGFGIVYLAQDHSLERQVALKEYMPAALAARADGSHITVRSAAFAETYAIGLRSFVNEARLLARFDHPSLVKVYRFWEDNGTAYMVMPFLRGVTLRDARRSMERAPDEPWVRSVIDPLLGALEVLHHEGVFHRDVAPDNILLPPSGAPILLDFGAARHVISDRTQSLTAILKPSYAPIEQYAEMSSMRQGPWTDIYALGAVMHYLLFGVPPAPATARAVQPDAEPVEQRSVPGVSPNLLATVGWALAVRPADRPQSIQMLRDALDGAVAIPEPAHVTGAAVPGAGALMRGAPAAPAPVTQPPNPAAQRPTTFPPTQRVERSSNPTRLDAAHEPGRPSAAAAEPDATVVRPPTLPPTKLAMPPVPPPAVAPAAAPATVTKAKPAPGVRKKGWMVAGLAAAGVVAVVVLWQFVSLLGAPRGVAAAQEGSASAPVAEASAPAVARTAEAPLPAPPAAVAAASAPPDVAVPNVEPSAPAVTTSASAPADAASVRGAAATAMAAASAPGRGRTAGRPVPVREGGEPVAGSPATTPSPGAGEAEARQRAQAAREAGYATRSGPNPGATAAFVPSGPRSATEFCGKRVFIALAICMDRECERPLFRDQPDCTRVLEMKRQRERN